MWCHQGGENDALTIVYHLPVCLACATTAASVANQTQPLRAVPGAATPMEDIIKAIILGFVEGLTEYLPVSSTGHLLLVEHFFGFGDKGFGNTFAVLIQFGAILALLSIYFWRLTQLALHFFTNAVARRFVFGVLLAFLPAAVVGFFLQS